MPRGKPRDKEKSSEEVAPSLSDILGRKSSGNLGSMRPKLTSQEQQHDYEPTTPPSDPEEPPPPTTAPPRTKMSYKQIMQEGDQLLDHMLRHDRAKAENMHFFCVREDITHAEIVLWQQNSDSLKRKFSTWSSRRHRINEYRTMCGLPKITQKNPFGQECIRDAIDLGADDMHSDYWQRPQWPVHPRAYLQEDSHAAGPPGSQVTPSQPFGAFTHPTSRNLVPTGADNLQAYTGSSIPWSGSQGSTTAPNVHPGATKPSSSLQPLNLDWLEFEPPTSHDYPIQTLATHQQQDRAPMFHPDELRTGLTPEKSSSSPSPPRQQRQRGSHSGDKSSGDYPIQTLATHQQQDRAPIFHPDELRTGLTPEKSSSSPSPPRQQQRQHGSHSGNNKSSGGGHKKSEGQPSGKKKS